MATADEIDPVKQVLIRYLVNGRDALRWKADGLSDYDKADGLSDYDVRRPMTPTATNLLGLLKHTAGVASEYFGLVFDRPFPDGDQLSWLGDQALPNDDMFATADESREQILAFWDRVWAHADDTIAALPLDAPGTVPWWPPERRSVTLGLILVHMTAELHRHAGHADIVRELIDGAAGLRSDHSNLPDTEDATWWEAYRNRVQAAADAHR